MPSPIIIRHLQLVKPTVQHRVQQRVMIPDVLKYSLRLESIHVQNVIQQSWSTTCDVIIRTADIQVTSQTNYKNCRKARVISLLSGSDVAVYNHVYDIVIHSPVCLAVKISIVAQTLR